MYKTEVPHIEITIESTGETYELMTLIHKVADERFEGNTFHPELDELWNLFN